jgi:hypothetical protein
VRPLLRLLPGRMLQLWSCFPSAGLLHSRGLGLQKGRHHCQVTPTAPRQHKECCARIENGIEAWQCKCTN